MASVPMGSVVRQFSRLFGIGTSSGLTEGQLLDRFVGSRDEEAFAAIVERFGPMVLGVCRKLVGDPHAAEDAFQATFLVLVRRAGSIRDGDLLGNWLYGVAIKVAKRSRAELSRRQSREKGDVDVDARSRDAPSDSRDFDTGPALHEELARLPEKYRAPLVLCFLDGRSHDEAARQLRWPVGTVKGRLARAKELLRDRLSRRGITITTAGISAALAETASAAAPEVLFQATVKAAMGIAAGGAIAAGAYSAPAIALSEGVVASMTLTKVKLAAAALVACGMVATGAGVMARQDEKKKADAPQGETKTTTENVTPPPGVPPDAGQGETKTIVSVPDNGGVPPEQAPARDVVGEALKFQPPIEKLPPMKELAQRRVRAAKASLDSVAAFYDSGTITIDRYLQVARALMEAKVGAAEDDSSRVKPVEEYVRLVRLIVRREKAKYEVGNGALPNVNEAELNLAEAEVLLAQAREGKPAATGEMKSVSPRGRGASDVGSIRPGPSIPGRVATGEGPDDEDDPANNQIIREDLTKPLSMPFATETPLEEVIKYIKNATATPERPQGIPIYIDPLGLQQSDKTMQSPIALNLDGIPLRTSLRLALKQLDLSYYIKDGLLVISSPKSDDFPDSALSARERADRAENKEAERQAKVKQQMMPAGGGQGGGFR